MSTLLAAHANDPLVAFHAGLLYCREKVGIYLIIPSPPPNHQLFALLPLCHLPTPNVYQYELLLQLYAEALKACHAGTTLDMRAVCVQSHLARNRPDMADKEVKDMLSEDEDATICQLCQAWVGLELGGARLRDAAYILQDLGDRYSWSPSLRSMLACAQMRMGQFEEAWKSLEQALEAEPEHADALANSVVCALHTGRATGPLVAQLARKAPGHPLLLRVKEAEDTFGKAVANMAG